MFNGKRKAITFSYDDGITQDIRLIEMLNKYGLKCTFNVNSEHLGTDYMLIREGQRISHYKIAPHRLKEVYEGHEIAVHTLTHPNLTACSDDEVVRQVEEDRKNLEALVGYDVVGMAYPGGSAYVDKRVEDLVREKTNVKYARGTDSSYSFDIPENLYHFKPTVYHLEFDKMMELGREFIELKPDTPKIFYIWGHAYEMDYGNSYWQKLEDFFELISGREDIFYGNNTEVLLSK